MSAADRAITKVSKGDHCLTGRPVSRGVAIGKVVCFHGDSTQFVRQKLKTKSDVVAEIARFRSAFEQARRQLDELSVKPRHAAVGEIFATHRTMLDSGKVREQIESQIDNRHLNAEAAVADVISKAAAKLRALTDGPGRDKYLDVLDIGERLHSCLGRSAKLSEVPVDGAVVAAYELKPSTLLALAERRPAALITETGGWTSHTFIIARELKIPAVTGVAGVFRKVKDGDVAAVDGFSGRIEINPYRKSLKAPANGVLPSRISRRARRGEGPKTLDGVEIKIRANADSVSAYKSARAAGARGIGLFRSESLLRGTQTIPKFAEQSAAYREIVAAGTDEGVKIRLFDLVDERGIHGGMREKNPALGLRAIRLGLARPGVLREQIKAILAASGEADVDIIIPMVTEVSEINRVREIASRALKLREKSGGRGVGTIRIGAMIEVPAAVLIIDQILEAAEFIMLGTNDLVQYTLAVDRDNEAVADWFSTLHPAVIISIKMVIAAASKAGKDVTVCGEMAGSPFYIPLLIGLGARDFSVNTSSVQSVSTVIESVAAEECRTLAKMLASSSSANESEACIRRAFETKWSHLAPDFVIDQTK